MKEIPNTALAVEMLPKADAKWAEIVNFAHAFNGYEHWGTYEKCSEVANQANQDFSEKGIVCETLTELRTCLFFEARRWRHYGYAPDKQAIQYIRALLKGIHNCITTGHLD